MKRDVPLMYSGVRVGWATFTESGDWRDVELILDIAQEEGDFNDGKVGLKCQFHDDIVYQMELVPINESPEKRPTKKKE